MSRSCFFCCFPSDSVYKTSYFLITPSFIIFNFIMMIDLPGADVLCGGVWLAGVLPIFRFARGYTPALRVFRIG